MTNHSLTEVPQDADDAALLVSIFGTYDGPAATRQKILAMEAVMQQAPQVLGDMPLFHHYADGLYSRELHVAAGTMLTGAIHKAEHLNIILKGDISVLTEDGMQRVRAPAMLESKPAPSGSASPTRIRCG